ncbi:MAG: hypothetical protein KF841_08570 [Phycisphaerae bacterium]|nr:hypothetical protein [Phycisphaerae bacterium]
MNNAEGGICFLLNLFLSTPQRVFDFFTGWIFDLFNIASPNFLRLIGDIFTCGF